MRRLALPVLAALALAGGTTAALAHGGDDGRGSRSRATDLAIIGDIPYGQAFVDAFPSRIAQINADPSVTRVVHLGDIKSGSSRCDTSYFELIRHDVDAFDDPFVYTPGDNEWTDCHRTNNGGYQPAGNEIPGAPVLTAGPSRLNEIRRIFFDHPGRTLGQHAADVDAQQAPYAENVKWQQAGVEFGVVNVPGSNNDLLPWFGAAETPALQQEQAKEWALRNAADLDWLDSIFATARREHAAGIAIGIQADVWDPEITGDPTQYSGFTTFVRELAKSERPLPQAGAAAERRLARLRVRHAARRPDGDQQHDLRDRLRGAEPAARDR